MSNIYFSPVFSLGESTQSFEREREEFFLSKEIAPVEAYKALPDYFKNITAYSADYRKDPDAQPTIKKCIPFLESLSQGYLIKSHIDVRAYFDKRDVRFDIRSKPSMTYGQTIETHPYEQLKTLVDERGLRYKAALKWVSPWAIKTDPGYSCLFVHPLNTGNGDIEFLSGVVDTDNYVIPVNFPFLVKNGVDFFEIRAGDPLVQVIPFKRESFNKIVQPISKDMERSFNMENIKHLSGIDNVYRYNSWHKNVKTKEPWYKRFLPK